VDARNCPETLVASVGSVLRLAEQDRAILRLAVPAFAALVCEPLFLLADAAVVGHLGTASLAALGIAGAVVATLVGLFVFLAYGTTASVARRMGAGDQQGALVVATDGLWLAVTLGAVVAALGAVFANRVVAAFDAAPAVVPQAETYLRIAVLGVPGLLVMLAATGVLRGMQDTRTPLVVAVVANLTNIALNVTLVYGAGLGIAGSAWGSVLAQTGAAAWLVAVVVRDARRHGARLGPDLAGIRASAHAGIPLVVRTLTLRAALLLTTFVAAAQGPTALAAHQVAFAVWTFLAFALDALAIAGQALTGHFLGAGDRPGVRAATVRMLWWGVATGVLFAALLASVSQYAGAVFTPDPAVRELLAGVLLVAALFQPVAGVVFVLDGVLIGAGDGRYLAWAGVVTLAVFVPLGWLVYETRAGLVWLWLGFGGFMLARMATLLIRARSGAWLVVGPAGPA
jgi:putative MATE family efflux protein